MPSLDELGLPLDIDETTLDVGAPDDVLAAVKTEGRRRRARRHRRNTAIAMLSVALLAAPALALLPGGDDDEVTVASDDSSTTTDQPSTTVPPTTGTTAVATETTIVAPPDATATTVPGQRPTTVPSTTVPPLVCNNSTNPACGPFRWEPAPSANQPLSASFASAPAQAVVGEEVTFVVDWSDPDDVFGGEAFSTDGSALGRPCVAYPSNRYGPWAPPAAQADGGTRTYRQTFTAPGTYTINVDLYTAGECDHPYASEAHLTTTITVADGGTPGA